MMNLEQLILRVLNCVNRLATNYEQQVPKLVLKESVLLLQEYCTKLLKELD